MYPDNYHLTEKESSYLLKKNIVELVYNAGKFEGLNTTLLQTEEIIKYNRANNVSVDDVLTIVNLKRGFDYLLQKKQEPLIESAKNINAIVAAEDALFPGEIRTGGVEVSTELGKYPPPLLTEEQVKKQFSTIIDGSDSGTLKAIQLFLFMAKNQIFWDGNKRTALITANKLMFDNQLGLLSIPSQFFVEFNSYLSNYYNNMPDAENEMIRYIYTHCIFGINY